MRGLQGEEWRVLKKYVKKHVTLKREVKPKDMGKDMELILYIWENYSKGFIGCEMKRALEEIKQEVTQ